MGVQPSVYILAVFFKTECDECQILYVYIILIIELYLFIQLSMTLTIFQGHSKFKVLTEMCALIQSSSNLV